MDDDKQRILEAYNTLQEAASKIQAYNWSKHPDRRAKHNEKTGKLISPYKPDEHGLKLCEASGEVLEEILSPDDAMALLHVGEIADKLKLAVEAGF